MMKKLRRIFTNRFVPLGPLLAVLPALLLSGCRAEGVDPASLSVIWISLDTLRADHMSGQGYERETSPFIDELAERGLMFEWAISPQGSTLPSHITQFTGIHPLVHGVMHASPSVGVTLAKPVLTLPQVLHEHGFVTRAWVDGGKMARSYGFDRGFDAYRDVQGPLSDKLTRALDALDRRSPERRSFFFIHTYEIHSPYAPGPPYDERYVSAGKKGEKGKKGNQSLAKLDRYDGSINSVDDQLRGFVAELEARGHLADTVLIITSDHGESFDEYGIPHVGHGALNLHQNLTRVPWVMLHPDSRYRGRISEPVGLIDFPSTLLAIVGVDPKLLGLGTNVLRREDRVDRSYLSWTGESKRLDGRIEQAWSLYADGHHLLHSDSNPGAERNGLFDMKRDPQERAALDDPELELEMRDRFEAHRQRLMDERDALPKPLAERRDMPRSLLLELVALGYMSEDPPTIEETHAMMKKHNEAMRAEARAAARRSEETPGDGEETGDGRSDSERPTTDRSRSD